jgi:superfamily II DNA or RNA helicase
MTNFRSVGLTYRQEGEVSSLALKYLLPIVSRAKQVILIVSNTASLYQATYGFSNLDADSEVRIAFTKEPAIPESKSLGNGDSAWASFLATKLRSGLLSVTDIANCSLDISPWIREHIEFGRPVVIGKDHNNNVVSWVWNTLGNDPQLMELQLRWSFGDPTRQIQSVVQLVEADRCKSTLLLIEHFKKWLFDLPSLRTPWIETFSSPDVAFELFPHQTKAVEEWLKSDCKGIFKMCTGAGKTITSLACIERLRRDKVENANAPVFVTVPTRVLADQWIVQSRKFGFADVLRAYDNASNWLGPLEPWMKARTSSYPRFVVSTYKTFADERMTQRLKRLAAIGVTSTWIADESHNLATHRLLHAAKEVQPLFSRRIGLSATPEIEGNLAATETIFRFFNNICATYELADGINEGVLCPYRYHPIPAYLDPKLGQAYLESLQDIENGRDSSRLIDLYRQSREIIKKSGVQLPALEGIIDNLLKDHSLVSHTLIYCPPGFSEISADVSDDVEIDPEQSRLLEEVVAFCRTRGLTVASILGETPGSQRSEILERFAQGKIQILCAIGCLDEGVDVPSIQRAIVLYSVDRAKQFVQRRGRILRQPRGQKKLADIYDVVILPHGTKMNGKVAARLLHKELRRYEIFADLAVNASQAKSIIDNALVKATEGQP